MAASGTHQVKPGSSSLAGPCWMAAPAPRASCRLLSLTCQAQLKPDVFRQCLRSGLTLAARTAQLVGTSPPVQHSNLSLTAGVKCRRRVGCRSVPASAPIPKTQIKPDLTFEAAGLKHRVHVFGIEHTSPQPSIAEFILQTRPAAVVVETALTPEHGSRPGNTISCKDRVIEGPAAFYLRMFCQVAAALTEEAEQKSCAVVDTDLWKQVSVGAYRGEQLVYIAALACGSPLVFGDRPKDITYRRLYTMATCAQLDEGYAGQAVRNYRRMLGQAEQQGPALLETASMVERITMQEREAVMCSVARDAASDALPALLNGNMSPQGEEGEQPSAPPAAVNKGDVVMVVGSAHLPGLEMLWEGGRWQELLGSSQTLDSHLLTALPLDTVPEHEVGLKRGLLHALLRLTATAEVLADVDQTLGPVPELQNQAFQAVCEVYGSSRMILSCLDRDLLSQVCGGVKPPDGPAVDMYEVLAPVRATRPSYGGPAYTEEMITFLRSLNFDLE